MNERIKQLAEQAHERKPVMVVDPQTGNPIQAGWANKPMYGNEFNPEKFAELIVREMCQVMKAEGEQFSLDQNFDAVKGVGRCMRRVKEHFGVE